MLSAGLYAAADTVNFPSDPSKLGYAFDKWLIDKTDDEATPGKIAELIGAAEHKVITVTPSYTEIPDANADVTVVYKYGTTVIETKDPETVHIGEGYAVTADEIDGYVFLKWTDGTGNDLSYNRSYFIQVTGDITLTAIYGTEATEAKPVITISGVSAITENNAHKLTASVTRSIPDGCTLLEHGVLYTKESGLDENSMVYGTPGVYRYISDSKLSDGIVKLNLKVSDDSARIYMRGYMTVEKDGTITTYYTDIVDGVYDDLKP